MNQERAHELLAAERTRIERALARLGQGTGEEADEDDPLNRAANLYQDEFDEGQAGFCARNSPRSSAPSRVS